MLAPCRLSWSSICTISPTERLQDWTPGSSCSPSCGNRPWRASRVCSTGCARSGPSVSTSLGRQVQRAVVRFMQGVLDHPENRSKLPHLINESLLHNLYEQTL